MQIILVHPRLSKARTITVSRGMLAGGIAALVLLLAVGSGLLSWATLRHADELRTRLAGSWLGASVAAPTPGAHPDYVRQNIDALAVRLGQIQAQLAGLDALGDRIVATIGWKLPEATRSGSAPPAARGRAARESPPAAPAAAPPAALPGAPSAPKNLPGRGGPYAPLSPERSLNSLALEIERVAGQLDRRLDQWSLLESDLLYQSVAAKLVPTRDPIREPALGSSYGWRADPFTGRTALHEGLDFNAPEGTPILAAGAGVVASVGTHPAYGLVVDLDHGAGVTTRYAHASRIHVRQGDIVRQGQLIAEVGSTGRSTGPHLHFELRVNGESRDPLPFLRDAGRGNALALAPRR